MRQLAFTPGGKQHHPKWSGAHVERRLTGGDPLLGPGQYAMATNEEEGPRDRRGEPLRCGSWPQLSACAEPGVENQGAADASRGDGKERRYFGYGVSERE